MLNQVRAFYMRAGGKPGLGSLKQAAFPKRIYENFLSIPFLLQLSLETQQRLVGFSVSHHFENPYFLILHVQPISKLAFSYSFPDT